MPFVNSVRSSFGPSSRFNRSASAARLEANVVTSGLVLSLDAKYPGTSPLTQWQDGSGNGRDFTWQATPTYNPNNNSGTYTMADAKGAYRLAPITNNTSCTFVFWMKTDDPQALFWSGTDLSDASGGFYLGAYNAGNKEYYGSISSSPQFLINTSDASNIYDFTRSSVWRMIEFKDVNLSTWQNAKFNMYNTFNFDSGEIGAIFVYNKTLSSAESTQNFNALRGRYGI
jgi:hypothetical protein